MTFIPNDVVGGTAIQHSIASPDAVDFSILLAADAGIGVASGLVVTPHSPGTDLNVNVAAGVVLINGTQYAIPAVNNKVVNTADGTNPRFDLVVCTAPGVNLLSVDEAGLEASLGSWAAYDANAFVSHSGAQAVEGSWSLGISALNTNNAIAFTNRYMPVQPSAVHTLTAWFRAATTGRAVLFDPQWFTSTYGFISNAGGGGVSDVTTGWLPATSTTTSPATAAYAQMRVMSSTPVAASELHYVDRISFVPTVGGISVVTGTAAANPVFPTLPANVAALAAVYVPAAATSIGATNLVDKRVMFGVTNVPKNYAARSYARATWR